MADDTSDSAAPLRALHRSSFGGISGGIASGSWREAKYWTWIETVAWLATRDEALMTRLKRLELRLREANSAKYVRAQLRDELQAELGTSGFELEAKRLLSRLEERSLVALDSRSLKEIPPGVWGLMPRALATGSKDVGVEPPGVLILRTDVLKISPPRKGAGRPSTAAAGRGRRKGVGGYAKYDVELAVEMHRLIQEGEATSVYGAAGLVAPKARGSNLAGTREKRLSAAYRRLYGCQDS